MRRVKPKQFFKFIGYRPTTTAKTSVLAEVFQDPETGFFGTRRECQRRARSLKNKAVFLWPVVDGVGEVEFQEL